MTAAVGVTAAAMAIGAGFGFIGKGHQAGDGDKVGDDDFHVHDGF